MLPLKVSHGVRPDALAYEVTSDEHGRPVIAWLGIDEDADADSVLGGAGPKAPEFERAGGGMLSSELVAGAEQLGISRPMLSKACRAVGVVRERARGEKNPPWVSRLSNTIKEEVVEPVEHVQGVLSTSSTTSTTSACSRGINPDAGKGPASGPQPDA